MKRSLILWDKKLFPGSDMVRKYTFKSMTTRGHSALLAKANHQISQDFATLRERSAFFQRKDCFECLSPHKIAA